jgi:hypothetical protein
MGLDAVEVVMGVEDEFGISIPDDRYSELKTVGDLCRFVAEEKGWVFRLGCQSPRVFCAIRRGLMSLGVTRQSVQLDTAMDQLLPHPRRAAWHRLGRECGLRLPPLRCPIEILVTVWSVPTLCLALMALLATNERGWVNWPDQHWFAATLGLIVSSAAAAVVTWYCSDGVPAHCRTVAESVRTILRTYSFPLDDDPNVIDEQHVFERVRRVVSDTLNMPSELISVHSRFIEDLWVD